MHEKRKTKQTCIQRHLAAVVGASRGWLAETLRPVVTGYPKRGDDEVDDDGETCEERRGTTMTDCGGERE